MSQSHGPTVTANVNEVERLEGELRQIHERLAAARRVSETVDEYVFGSARGSVRLSELFGAHRDLIVVHNMGSRCPYCTMWADGFTGVLPYLAQRAAFVISSPDPPDVQQAFARDRSWPFTMVSTAGSTFAHDMGFEPEAGKCLPGVSVFHKVDGRITRTGFSTFGPGDAFCPVWHFFDMLPDGRGDWRPRL